MLCPTREFALQQRRVTSPRAQGGSDDDEDNGDDLSIDESGAISSNVTLDVVPKHGKKEGKKEGRKSGSASITGTTEAKASSGGSDAQAPTRPSR